MRLQYRIQLKTINTKKINVNGSTHIQQHSANRYSQRYSDNTKRPKPKENQLGILKIYAFCQKIQQRASGPGECCWGYISKNENTPKQLPHLPPKS